MSDCVLVSKCTKIMWLFRSSSPFPLNLAKTSHIPSQQESNHFLLLLMLNSGKWPQIFSYIQRNHPKKSKCRGSPSRSWKTLAGRCWSDGDPIFLHSDFSNLWLPGSHSLVSLKEIGCSVGFMQNSPADLHLLGFCGISADRAESGLNSQYFAFSQNSTCGAIWGFFSLVIVIPSFPPLVCQNVFIIGLVRKL